LWFAVLYPLLRTDPASTDLFTLSLHDALPIFTQHDRQLAGLEREQKIMRDQYDRLFTTINAIDTKLDLLHVDLSEAKGGLKFGRDRKSTRLNSSHVSISYAVFCLKKKTPYYNP